MTNRDSYTPRRCSKRWLDSDCPAEVLAIIDHGGMSNHFDILDRFDVIYANVETVQYEGSSRIEKWMVGYSLSESGAGYHFEMPTYEVAAYRYRMKHRYAKWSTLPESVKSAVRRDIAETAKYIESLTTTGELEP